MSGAVFTARYRGVCPSCGESIEPGQDVRYDQARRVEHVDCDAVIGAPRREAPVCPSCWLAHAGECA